MCCLEKERFIYTESYLKIKIKKTQEQNKIIASQVLEGVLMIFI